MKKGIIGGIIGFTVGVLFIWLYGAFVQWDLMWIKEVSTWPHVEKFSYSIGWLFTLFVSTGLGVMVSTND